MKIRNGFVSNSSSSSFIVAFPNKPKTVEEMANILFGKTDGVFDNEGYDNTRYTYMEIAEAVLSNLKKESKKKLIDTLSYRLNYSPYHGFYEKSNRYFGTNKDDLERLTNLFQKENREIEESREKVDSFLNNLIGKVEYASEGIESSKEKIERYEKYIKKLSIIENENEEYKKISGETFKLFNKYREGILKLQLKISKEDLKLFTKENDGCFIGFFTFSDGSSLGSAIEHGNTFRRLNHIKINQH